MYNCTRLSAVETEMGMAPQSMMGRTKRGLTVDLGEAMRAPDLPSLRRVDMCRIPTASVMNSRGGRITSCVKPAG